ncbi:putative E3 ubiquitin-protein ligase RING1a isoform X2 [Syzygium oleosum]|uniref:putative E3 ubiquitin-protein ligase RING1a isoform X2 n=1 Tax=Syzygium oleosum TaxID=219896 RepID=UPI0011D21AE4|nr:putative E3 ubiquitin-protein ligase RING1a isoform X2 [Syzygium oleosum]
MPAQKRSLPENADDEDASQPSGHHHGHHHGPHAKQSRRDGDPEQDDQQPGEPQGGGGGGRGAGGGGAEEEEEEEDSQGSPSSSSEEKPEFVYVKLSDIRKDVQCPICLGIIRKTRTVMECLHRFCRECIDKSMRLGNNECPACRTHCASRRSLRDDPNFDALIAALYPDIDKYEEEELAFHEEERNRNKQIQASIAQILQRQSEALVKRRTLGKDPAGGFITRSQRNLRPSTRRRRNSRGTDHQGSEDNEDEHDSNGGKDSSSADERGTEVRQRRRRKRTGVRSSLPSSSADVECPDNDLEATRDTRGISPGLVWNPEMLAWGRGGTRSHTRHGGVNGNNKNSKNMRLSKLVEYLKSLEENDELDVYFMLVSLDKESTPSLKQPYLCSRRSLSVKHLCDYVAQQTPLQTEEVEILMVKGNHNISRQGPSLNLFSLGSGHENVLPVVDPHKAELQILEKEATLAGIIADNGSISDILILGFQQKRTSNS